MDVVFAHFGVRPVESCYRYAPVFPVRVAGRKVALKRTPGQITGARGLGTWLRALAAAGVRVVVPAELPMENPVAIGDEVWVAYPWVDGRTYNGSRADVTAAGDLLGRIHAMTASTDGVQRFTWPDHDAASVAEDVEGLRRVLAGPAGHDGALRRLEADVTAFMTTTLPAIRDADLPATGVPLDFKATNLVYGPDGPVLVDADNAEHAPRLLDLANAALLFHNDCGDALFSPAQWTAFRTAYRRHVTLTADEVRLWPVAVRYMLCEWAVWSLIDAERWGDWERDPARAFLADLARTDEHRFDLGV